MARIRRGGQRIRGSDGKRTRNDDCCCCDCETDGPTAAFSVQQTNHDPCTYDLTDASTAGACGAIVSRSWKVEGVEVSTATNPTDIEIPDGDTLTLTVTDEYGCEDTTGLAIECCDCDTEGPTGDFSYEQTGDDPCTIDLTDESTAGSCGASIVSWVWKLNTVQFSTSQNPTDVEVEDGDTVELTITDENGCVDVVDMEIACDTGPCVGDTCQDLCNAADLPGEFTVTIASYPGSCSFFNRAYVLTQDSEGSCGYTLTEGSDVYTFALGIVSVGETWCGAMRFTMSIPGFPSYFLEWTKNVVPGDNGVVDGDCTSFSGSFSPTDVSTDDVDCFVFGSPATGYTITVVATG